MKQLTGHSSCKCVYNDTITFNYMYFQLNWIIGTEIVIINTSLWWWPSSLPLALHLYKLYSNTRTHNIECIIIQRRFLQFRIDTNGHCEVNQVNQWVNELSMNCEGESFRVKCQVKCVIGLYTCKEPILLSSFLHANICICTSFFFNSQ